MGPPSDEEKVSPLVMDAACKTSFGTPGQSLSSFTSFIATLAPSFDAAWSVVDITAYHIYRLCFTSATILIREPAEFAGVVGMITAFTVRAHDRISADAERTTHTTDHLIEIAKETIRRAP